MGRLLDVVKRHSFVSLGGSLLSFGVDARSCVLLAGNYLVEIDPAALLVADGALKSAKAGVLECSVQHTRIRSILPSVFLVQEPDRGLLEGILTGTEELGVVI